MNAVHLERIDKFSMPEYDRQQGRDTELVLAPGSFAFVQDNTKGQINVLRGPYKSSLSNTDQLVTFDGKRYQSQRDQSQAVQQDIVVPRNSYVVLENPAKEGKQPDVGTSNTLANNFLRMGQTENLAGPQSFALWPGQTATVIQGHHLRSNQYLLGRVTDGEAAKANWDKTVVEGAESGAETNSKNALGIDKNSLVTGQIIVIKGTSVAFYMPPTGIEILQDENKKYTRDAVTLERLEYSILLDENGNKEYRKGPDVVFPTPTQQFFQKDGARKFRAQELQPTTGMHIKVIADYEENGTQYKAGDELFITGATQPIYYPREEHATITYGGLEKTFSIAIPAGEGRYVLDRATGDIKLVVGPKMFLPDPRKEVVVRRVLSPTECNLYYPGNQEVRSINSALSGTSYDVEAPSAGGAADYDNIQSYLEDTRLRTRSFAAAAAAPAMFESNTPREKAGKGLAGDALSRGTTYTPPRTITLPTKYDGAVRISVWTGYAVQVVNSAGERRTVIGPQTILLGYDEYLERLTLSTGKPKSVDRTINDVYLRYKSNPVSDVISLKTQDLVNVDIHVKYLVRFEDDQQDKWFSVDNYVQYMVDHLRSLIGNTVRNVGVQEFYGNAANILRDTVLGTKSQETGERPLKRFTENGMTVYDLELIAITVKDGEIARLLSDSRQKTLQEAIELDRKKAELELVKGKEEANRQIEQERATTAEIVDGLKALAIKRLTEADLEAIRVNNLKQVETEEGKKAAALIAQATKALYLATTKAEDAHRQEQEDLDAAREIKVTEAEAAATKERMGAISPALVEAIVSLAQTGQLEAIGEHLAPLSIVQGQSLAGTLQTMFAGTPLEGMVNNLDKLSKVKSAK